MPRHAILSDERAHFSPVYELIAELAYRIYEQEGCPEDQADEHWRRAERALQQLRLRNPPDGLRQAERP